VEELRDRLLAEELLGWACYFEIKRDAEKEQLEKAKQKSGSETATPRSKRTMGSRGKR